MREIPPDQVRQWMTDLLVYARENDKTPQEIMEAIVFEAPMGIYKSRELSQEERLLFAAAFSIAGPGLVSSYELTAVALNQYSKPNDICLQLKKQKFSTSDIVIDAARIGLSPKQIVGLAFDAHTLAAKVPIDAFKPDPDVEKIARRFGARMSSSPEFRAVRKYDHRHTAPAVIVQLARLEAVFNKRISNPKYDLHEFPLPALS